MAETDFTNPTRIGTSGISPSPGTGNIVPYSPTSGLNNSGNLSSRGVNNTRSAPSSATPDILDAEWRNVTPQPLESWEDWNRRMLDKELEFYRENERLYQEDLRRAREQAIREQEALFEEFPDYIPGRKATPKNLGSDALAKGLGAIAGAIDGYGTYKDSLANGDSQAEAIGRGIGRGIGGTIGGDLGASYGASVGLAGTVASGGTGSAASVAGAVAGAIAGSTVGGAIGETIGGLIGRLFEDKNRQQAEDSLNNAPEKIETSEPEFTGGQCQGVWYRVQTEEIDPYGNPIDSLTNELRGKIVPGSSPTPGTTGRGVFCYGFRTPFTGRIWYDSPTYVGPVTGPNPPVVPYMKVTILGRADGLPDTCGNHETEPVPTGTKTKPVVGTPPVGSPFNLPTPDLKPPVFSPKPAPIGKPRGLPSLPGLGPLGGPTGLGDRPTEDDPAAGDPIGDPEAPENPGLDPFGSPTTGNPDNQPLDDPDASPSGGNGGGGGDSGNGGGGDDGDKNGCCTEYENLTVKTIKCEFSKTEKKYVAKEVNTTIQIAKNKNGSEKKQIQELFAALARIEKESCEAKNQELTLSVPEWWQVRVGADRPQLQIIFAERNKNGKLGSSRWTTTIPHFDESKRKSLKSMANSLIHTKGNHQAIVVLNDNSKIIVYANSANNVELFVKTLLKLVRKDKLKSPLEIAIGQRKGSQLKERKVVPVLAHYWADGQLSSKPKWSEKLTD